MDLSLKPPKKSDLDKKNLEYDYIPYSGYFTEAKLFFIQETELIFQGEQS